MLLKLCWTEQMFNSYLSKQQECKSCKNKLIIESYCIFTVWLVGQVDISQCISQTYLMQMRMHEGEDGGVFRLVRVICCAWVWKEIKLNPLSRYPVETIFQVSAALWNLLRWGLLGEEIFIRCQSVGQYAFFWGEFWKLEWWTSGNELDCSYLLCLGRKCLSG